MARAKKVTVAPKVYKINREARNNVCDMMVLIDALWHFSDCDIEIPDETYSAIIAVRNRIEYKQDPQSWGYRPKVTLKQLDIVTRFVSNNW